MTRTELGFRTARDVYSVCKVLEDVGRSAELGDFKPFERLVFGEGEKLNGMELTRELLIARYGKRKEGIGK